MGRKATGRNPVITVSLLDEEREQFEASVPEGKKITDLGRERFEAKPNPDEWDMEEAMKPLLFLDQAFIMETSAENRAYTLRHHLFPEYEPLTVHEYRIKGGADEVGKRGRKAATVKDDGTGVKEVRRSARVKIVVKREAYEDIRLIAEALGLSVNTYCRRVLMGQPVFAFELHMGVEAVRRHAEGVIAIKKNGLEAEMAKAAERLAVAEAEKIARSAAREVAREHASA